MINLSKITLRTAEDLVLGVNTITNRVLNSTVKGVDTFCDFVDAECDDINTERAKERRAALRKPKAKAKAPAKGKG